MSEEVHFKGGLEINCWQLDFLRIKIPYHKKKNIGSSFFPECSRSVRTVINWYLMPGTLNLKKFMRFFGL